MLVGGATLALASALAGGYTALAGGQHTIRPRAEAAAATGAVRAQNVDLASGGTTFHARIKNFGFYSAGVCVKPAISANSADQKCTGDINLGQSETKLDVDLPLDPNTNTPAIAEVIGFPRNDGITIFGGFEEKHINVQTTLGDDTANTHCFRFDGTVWGFKFGETSCDGF